MSFRPGVQPRERRKADVKKEMPSTASAAVREATPAPNALSISIRPDTMIVIQGLPYDLNETEATKIANIIRAMVTPAT